MDDSSVRSYSAAEMAARRVRYDELRPCTNAFIDSRTPGSDRKENFTIIGPGVAENPEQHVHIREPHGFNIGAARQPPGCVNSQHSHETAEVFVVHRGGFRFKTGERGVDGSVDLGPGDLISIPTRAFRGFDTIGDHTSFMFAVLGGDDPGRVTWAPHVLEAAREHGLVLLADGRLIDTTLGETVPEGAAVMPLTTPADVAAMHKLDSSAIAACTVRHSDLRQRTGGAWSKVPGVAEHPVIGRENLAESMPAGPLNWPHPFQVRLLEMQPGAELPKHARSSPEVLLIHEGRIAFEWAQGALELDAGSTFTVPRDVVHSLANRGETAAQIYVVLGGDAPDAPRVP